MLIRTEGYALAAEVEIDGHRLVVMDDFSPPGGKKAPGVLQNVEIFADEFEALPWEEVFSGNPDKEKRLVHLGGWTYLAYGQVVQIGPTRVDFGIVQLDAGPQTRDQRCVGEFIKLKIDRLALRLLDNKP